MTQHHAHAFGDPYGSDRAADSAYAQAERDLRAAGWLPPDEAERLRSSLANMQRNAETLADEVVHAHAQLAAVQPVIDAARALRQRLEPDGSPFVIDHRYFATTRALAAVVDALDADSPPEGLPQ